jgi:hypothetical protein
MAVAASRLAAYPTQRRALRVRLDRHFHAPATALPNQPLISVHEPFNWMDMIQDRLYSNVHGWASGCFLQGQVYHDVTQPWPSLYFPVRIRAIALIENTRSQHLLLLAASSIHNPPSPVSTNKFW